jgi:Domain of unknown function (DUF6438)
MGSMTARNIFPLLALLSASEAHAQIVLERTSCFGTCPAYRLEVRPEGSVMFTGHNRFAVGSGTKHLTPGAVDSLTKKIVHSGFGALPDSTVSGSPGCRASATDHPSIILRVTNGLQTKTVTFDLGCYGDSVPKDGPGLQAMFDHPPTNRVLIERLAALVDSVVGVGDWLRKPQPGH